MAADFERQSYWHDRFASETQFEWLIPSDQFISIMQPHLVTLRPSARILHLGGGTSDLQNHFRSRGFRDVTNADYEPLAAERGRQIEEKAFGDVEMRYAVADATELTACDEVVSSEGEKYDFVVDKSTVDTVACGGEAALMGMIHSVKNCLAEGGVWITLSFSAVRFDVADLPFNVEVLAKVPTPKAKPTDPDIFHWCYILSPR